MTTRRDTVDAHARKCPTALSCCFPYSKIGPPAAKTNGLLHCCQSVCRAQPPTYHQEELAERSRKPTKLCIEHHLHQRGSKSQTFVLPAPTLSRSRHFTASTTGNPPEGVVAERQSKAVSTPDLDGQEKSGDLLVLPPATSLIELALTPFKQYRQSRRTANGGGLHGGAVARLGGGVVGAGEMAHQKETLPPVVKLNVSLLAFETVGPGPPTTAPPGQRTLRDMMWLEKTTSTSTAAGAKCPNGAASPPPSQSKVSGESAAAPAEAAVPGTVAPSPVARVAPAGIPSSIADHVAGLPKTGELIGGNRSSIPRKMEETGSILVRCPKCRACLPVGETWDTHREEHLLVAATSDHQQPDSGIRTRRPSPHPHLSTTPPQRGALSPELVECATGTRKTSGAGNVGRLEGDFLDFGDDIPPSDAEARIPTQEAAGGSSDGDAGRRQSRKLSQLLMIAVTPEQATNVLQDRGFLRNDMQTRFANLGLVGAEFPREQQEERAFNE